MLRQELEIRRLTNLLVAPDVNTFHAIQAVDPEPVKYEDNTEKPKGQVVMGDGFTEYSMSDEGFDDLGQG